MLPTYCPDVTPNNLKLLVLTDTNASVEDVEEPLTSNSLVVFVVLTVYFMVFILFTDQPLLTVVI